jgi:hypothetical protein
MQQSWQWEGLLKQNQKIKSTVNKVTFWKKWGINLNESKSLYTDFTNKKIRQQPTFINGTEVPLCQYSEISWYDS